ncbi:MAG TPA: COR domain-containing protein [Thermoanaerobaculia bacterium]|nr:COR domain-containing protein [Thermoanaerobaculia bacterium]
MIAEYKTGVGTYSSDTLRLNELGLEKVPESIRTIRNLRILDLGQNKISEIPEWFGELTTLTVLDLADNRLRSLPDTIGRLTKLLDLYLSNNLLESLPETLQGLSLQTLWVGRNPALGLPESLLTRRPVEVLRYYLESRTENSRPLRELKLLLVGRGKAGKTTVVKRLANEPPDPRESETHSIAIRELALSCPGGEVRTRAWDFGGQEILHSTHQFFLTERSLYLLVLEPRTGSAQKDAEYWLKLIEAQGNGSPAIVVLNWSRGRPWRVDEVKLRRKFPFIVAFMPVDALHGDGVNELRETIVSTVEQMPDVWLPFPKRWRAIKDAVGGMHGNFLTYDQYTELCSNHGEERSDAQADLAGILHALGLALYFGKDPKLHDTRVLNPSWVTGGVYAVIRAPSVAANDGQLTVADMPRVLAEAEAEKVIDANDYPKESHRFILELMRAFQLCYTREEEDGKPTRYLVPERLPEFEPEMKENWEQAEVRLRYRYEILPPGLLPRFIVRTHELSEDAPHWRHGVVLRHAKAQALIREEPDRQELHVFVLGGDEETRRVLAAMVRRELQALHVEMKMQPVEDLELTGSAEQWIGVKALREIEAPERPTQKLPVLPEGTAEIHVSRELDKLVPPEARAIDREPETAPVPVRLFVSYAHENERQLKRLDAILGVLELQHGLASWTDQRLIAGQEWDRQIRQRVEEADIFLFIASQASLVRPYIRDIELQRAKERHAAGEVEIVTVKLEPCASDEDPFLGKLQRLAPKFKSVAEVSPRSLVWEQVRKDLLPVIARVREKKSAAR